MTREQREKKISMISDLNFWGWEVSKYWNFKYLQRMHNYLLDFIAERGQEVALEPNPKDYMWDFLVLRCGISTQDIRNFCYPPEHQTQAFNRVDFLSSWINALDNRAAGNSLFRLYCTKFFDSMSSAAWCEENLSEAGHCWHENFCDNMLSNIKPLRD